MFTFSCFFSCAPATLADPATAIRTSPIQNPEFVFRTNTPQKLTEKLEQNSRTSQTFSRPVRSLRTEIDISQMRSPYRKQLRNSALAPQESNQIQLRFPTEKFI